MHFLLSILMVAMAIQNAYDVLDLPYFLLLFPHLQGNQLLSILLGSCIDLNFCLLLIFMRHNFFAILEGEKYLVMKLCANSSHVVMEPLGNAKSQCLALSRKENGNSLNMIVSSIIPLHLKVSQKKCEKING